MGQRWGAWLILADAASRDNRALITAVGERSHESIKWLQPPQAAYDAVRHAAAAWAHIQREQEPAPPRPVPERRPQAPRQRVAGKRTLQLLTFIGCCLGTTAMRYDDPQEVGSQGDVLERTSHAGRSEGDSVTNASVHPNWWSAGFRMAARRDTTSALVRWIDDPVFDDDGQQPDEEVQLLRELYDLAFALDAGEFDDSTTWDYTVAHPRGGPGGPVCYVVDVDTACMLEARWKLSGRNAARGDVTPELLLAPGVL